MVPPEDDAVNLSKVAITMLNDGMRLDAGESWGK